MQTPDTKTGHYYVTVKDGARTAVALGPFTNDHAAALARVDEVKAYVQEHDVWGAFYAFGTSRLPLEITAPPEGKLNAALGLGEELAVAA